MYVSPVSGTEAAGSRAGRRRAKLAAAVQIAFGLVGIFI
jgi:hypothetical protein